MKKDPTTVIPPLKIIIGSHRPPAAVRIEPAMVDPTNWPGKVEEGEATRENLPVNNEVKVRVEKRIEKERSRRCFAHQDC